MTRARNAMGPRIRELREARGLTLYDLADGAGISANHLSRIERGSTAPAFTVGMHIARVLGVKASELASIDRAQADTDAQLISTLTSCGIDPEIAQHICTRISTPARSALLEVVRQSKTTA